MVSFTRMFGVCDMEMESIRMERSGWLSFNLWLRLYGFLGRPGKKISGKESFSQLYFFVFPHLRSNLFLLS